MFLEETTLDSEEIKPVVIAIIELCLSEGINQYSWSHCGAAPRLYRCVIGSKLENTKCAQALTDSANNCKKDIWVCSSYTKANIQV